MTIDEAIEELERGTKQNRSTNNQRLREALGLGGEALKRIKDNRENFLPFAFHKLSGEAQS